MILKFQQGGGAMPPLLTYNPVVVKGNSTANPVEPKQPVKENKSDLTDKDLLGLIDKLEGLPNDSQHIVAKL